MPAPVAHLVAAKRSPIGKFLGGLTKMSATEIGSHVARALFAEAGTDLAAVDEVFIGQVLQAGAGQNPARQVALAAGLPNTISATTVNKVCGSGLQAIMFAHSVIRAGEAEVVLAGGMESMTNAPFLVRGMRTGHKFGDVPLVDSMLYDGLTNVYDQAVMGVIAEETAARAKATRTEQDAWAVQSHQRAVAAERAGHFAAERVAILGKAGAPPFNTDETVRADTSMETLGALKPVFAKDGTVTAGNASALSDGAALVLVASEAGLRRAGGTPLGRIVATATAGGPPRELFFAPIKACQQVCARAGWELGSVDLWEINEAFASQMVACLKGLELPPERVNISGGAIALGHPIGASGARVLVTLVHNLRRTGSRRGVASLCLGGGNAVALAVEAA